MARTFFLVTGIVLTALAVAVPSALGQVGRIVIHDHGDATQAKLQSRPMVVIRDYGDATQAKLQLQSTAMEAIRDHGDATQAKLTRLSTPVIARESVQKDQGQSTSQIVRDNGDAEQAKLAAAQSASTPSVVESTSSWELSWSELGIGLGVGIFLVGGLILAVQFTRNQRLAH